VEQLVLVLLKKTFLAGQRQLEAVVTSTGPQITLYTTIARFSNCGIILSGKDGLSYLLEMTSKLIKEH